MEDDSQFGKVLKWALGVTGLGAVAAVFALPKPLGIWMAVVILVLALVLFGGYFLWRRLQARRRREQFSAAIEAQTAAAPKTISDPNQRAALDKLRQKFQTGLQEFKNRGKDLYKLPWFVIIGEPGSGKSEAIRHSGIDFPPGMQDELQGSGGTVNMDWWFTNRGIILDTAGSMLFNEARAGEAPEWREFLRLLRKARPSCPVNGLFLVLSVESLIRDSADTIAKKASRLAQQLDLIQKTLDVRFPVYLLVTKCDLLTGFREFFDNIEDPILQHQIFGWSNPEPLDAHFRPDLMDQHLQGIASRLRRRRLALLRETAEAGRLGETQHFFAPGYQLGKGAGPSRRLDQVDALFALPESINRLAPRLRLYLETIFVAGEWSAKPVFLRGIYFTSSLREGKALDEAIAFATGLSLDQLPEDRTWEKNRAYFLRDLFIEKVFRESGLVTRASNTLKMLRQRQLAIFGTAGVALLLLLVFAGFANSRLKKTIRNEAAYWKAAATNWNQGIWSPSIVHMTPGENLRYAYAGTNLVPGTDLTLVKYHQRLSEVAATNLSVSWVFKPMAWMNVGDVNERARAQRRVFEGGVLEPLVRLTRAKMGLADPSSPEALARHRDAWLALLDLEDNGFNTQANERTFPNPAAPTKYLKSFLSYLAGEDFRPDTNLVNVFVRTYSAETLKRNDGVWPPPNLVGKDALATNSPLVLGLQKFHESSGTTRTNISQHLAALNEVADKLKAFHEAELSLTNASDPCGVLESRLKPSKAALDQAWLNLDRATNFPAGLLTNITERYMLLARAASNASASVILRPIELMLSDPRKAKGHDFFRQVMERATSLASGAADFVYAEYNPRAKFLGLLDEMCVAQPTNQAASAYQLRWSLYTNACALAAAPVKPDESTIGGQWKQFETLRRAADQFRATLTNYSGPYARPVGALCARIASDAEQRLQTQYVEEYVKLAGGRLASVSQPARWEPGNLTNAGMLLASLGRDLEPEASAKLGPQADKLETIRKQVADAKRRVFDGVRNDLGTRLGFPVALEGTQSLRVEDLSVLRRHIDGMLNALKDPVWATGPAESRATLQSRCDEIGRVVGALVKGDGAPTEYELFFVPPGAASSQEDQFIVKVFRKLQVSSGSAARPIEDLSRIESPDDPACSLGKFPLNASLAFSFSSTRSPNFQPPIKADSWQLIRFIQSGKATLLEDGRKWRFKVALEEENSRGEVTFEARLADGQALPKRDAWLAVK